MSYKYLGFLIAYLITTLVVSVDDVTAQTIMDSDLSLEITSQEFEGGFIPGEQGHVNINITNYGPNTVNISDSMFVTLGYNVAQDDFLAFEILFSDTNDPNCEFIFSNASPRPPVNNILYFHTYTIHADIPVGHTYTCSIPVTFSDVGYLETVWRMSYSTSNGVVTLTSPFNFRGSPRPVPIGNGVFALVAIILISGWYFKKQLF